MYKHFFKRIFDFIFSLIAIITLSPLMIIIAILVRVKLGSPVLFKQKRPGKNEKIFTMYKFRTMTNKTDVNGNLLHDSERLTKFGKFLRSTSLDELPELYNILIGDMSLIGPRPLAVEYLPYYYDNERIRHSVRPGLTGLAQVNGRNTLNWEERFSFDIQYVNKLNLFMDIKIIFRTFIKIFYTKDVTIRGTTNIIDFNVYRSNNKNE